MSDACSDTIWLHGLLVELGFPQIWQTSRYANHTSGIQIVANHVFHELTKQIEVDCHSICHVYDDKVVTPSGLTSILSFKLQTSMTSRINWNGDVN